MKEIIYSSVLIALGILCCITSLIVTISTNADVYVNYSKYDIVTDNIDIASISAKYTSDMIESVQYGTIDEYLADVEPNVDPDELWLYVKLITKSMPRNITNIAAVTRGVSSVYNDPVLMYIGSVNKATITSSPAGFLRLFEVLEGRELTALPKDAVSHSKDSIITDGLMAMFGATLNRIVTSSDNIPNYVIFAESGNGNYTDIYPVSMTKEVLNGESRYQCNGNNCTLTDSFSPPVRNYNILKLDNIYVSDDTYYDDRIGDSVAAPINNILYDDVYSRVTSKIDHGFPSNTAIRFNDYKGLSGIYTKTGIFDPVTDGKSRIIIDDDDGDNTRALPGIDIGYHKIRNPYMRYCSIFSMSGYIDMISANDIEYQPIHDYRMDLCKLLTNDASNTSYCEEIDSELGVIITQTLSTISDAEFVCTNDDDCELLLSIFNEMLNALPVSIKISDVVALMNKHATYFYTSISSYLHYDTIHGNSANLPLCMRATFSRAYNPSRYLFAIGDIIHHSIDQLNDVRDLIQDYKTSYIGIPSIMAWTTDINTLKYVLTALLIVFIVAHNVLVLTQRTYNIIMYIPVLIVGVSILALIVVYLIVVVLSRSSYTTDLLPVQPNVTYYKSCWSSYLEKQQYFDNVVVCDNEATLEQSYGRNSQPSECVRASMVHAKCMLRLAQYTMDNIMFDVTIALDNQTNTADSVVNTQYTADIVLMVVVGVVLISVPAIAYYTSYRAGRGYVKECDLTPGYNVYMCALTSPVSTAAAVLVCIWSIFNINVLGYKSTNLAGLVISALGAVYGIVTLVLNIVCVRTVSSKPVT